MFRIYLPKYNRFVQKWNQESKNVSVCENIQDSAFFFTYEEAAKVKHLVESNLGTKAEVWEAINS